MLHSLFYSKHILWQKTIYSKAVDFKRSGFTSLPLWLHASGPSSLFLIFFIYIYKVGGLNKMIFDTIIPKPSQFSELHVGCIKKIHFWAQRQEVLIRIHNEVSWQLLKANSYQVLCSTWYTGLFVFISLQLFKVNTAFVPVMIYFKFLIACSFLYSLLVLVCLYDCILTCNCVAALYSEYDNSNICSFWRSKSSVHCFFAFIHCLSLIILRVLRA